MVHQFSGIIYVQRSEYWKCQCGQSFSGKSRFEEHLIGEVAKDIAVNEFRMRHGRNN